jgi:hypothetical protein
MPNIKATHLMALLSVADERRFPANLVLFEQQTESFVVWWGAATMGPYDELGREPFQAIDVYLSGGSRTGRARLVDRSQKGKVIKLALIGETPLEQNIVRRRRPFSLVRWLRSKLFKRHLSKNVD